MSKHTACNLMVSAYDGSFVFSYECVSERRCAHALFETMPPEQHMECHFYQKGQCLNATAQIKALAAVKAAVSRMAKRIEEERDAE